jgi:hypothetical protein
VVARAFVGCMAGMRMVVRGRDDFRFPELEGGGLDLAEVLMLV